jgi:hypothetical protein
MLHCYVDSGFTKISTYEQIISVCGLKLCVTLMVHVEIIIFSKDEVTEKHR